MRGMRAAAGVLPDAGGFDWAVVIRTLLIVGLVGSCIGLVIDLIALGRVLGRGAGSHRVETGTRMWPCSATPPRRTGSPANARRGNRRSSPGRAISASSRANGAPRQ